MGRERVILLSVRVEAEASERRELVQALIASSAAARQEPGSTETRISEDLEQAGVYYLTSRWRDDPELEAYVAGPAFGILLGALEVLGRRSRMELTRSQEGAEHAVALIGRVRGRVPQLDHTGGLSASEEPSAR